ncbi:MAG TPA: basic secretory protein-like protein [Gemmatimonadaceae bacterium]|nr:basic secretory protein-like protein [Gemmatimonadaceae bacterium]
MRSDRAPARVPPAVALAALVILAAVAPAALSAQYTQFGQNQVQYTKFRWMVKKSEHFDVHYYKGMEEGATIVARMAERSYARLSRLMGYQFKERKPIVVFASRGDFAQNNVTGDLGEGTGGVTDAIHQRNMFFFGQDLAEVEHVLTHEMVHQFQYDILLRGRTGTAAVATMTTSSSPPLWFIEGMAEYLSIGPDHPATDAIMRDAALNGKLPTIEEMNDPNAFFPYRFGESLWRYVGQRWGDEIIGEIMLATPTLGLERAFKRHTGLELDDLGDEWKDATQTAYLPGIASLERPRKVAQPLLNARKTGGIIPVYIAPALSSDGRQIAYISTGSLLRAEVFLDLYLADATTGKRLKRLTNSVLNSETEELRYAYSQSAFSPDGRLLAYTGYREGKDVLFVLDVRSRQVLHRLDTGLEAMVGPSWSPDGKRLAFSGAKNGLTNIYVIDADGRNLRQLTTGTFAGLMPNWSPDGRRIAFVSDRGPRTNLDLLKFGKWEINILDLESSAVETIPGQAGKNLNPAWAPDGKSVAFISDRTGIPQVFLYDFDTKEHFQITRLIGGVQSLTENSPAMTWARQADKLAFVYFDNGDYTVWSLSNPRQLKREPYRESPVASVVAKAGAGVAPLDSAQQRAAAAAAAVAALAREARTASRDSLGARRQSLYRGPTGLRTSGELPPAGAPGSQSAISVAALLDSVALALPSATSFKDETYRAALQAERVFTPQVTYSQTNFGGGVFGGSGVLLADLLGNRQLLLFGSVNGRLEEAQVAVQYANFANRTNYRAGVQQYPFFLFAGAGQQQVGAGQYVQTQSLTRYIVRTADFATMHPTSRFSRFEFSGTFLNIDRSALYISRGIAFDSFGNGYATPFYVDSIKGLGSLNYLSPAAAWVSDNALFAGGSASGAPIFGHRYRLGVTANIGSGGFTTYQGDLRRYDAVLFSFLTFATRLYANVNVGPGESQFGQQFLGIPQYIRGYDREYYSSSACAPSAANQCIDPLTQLIGTRVMLASAELRFPLVRRFDLGVLPISLPRVDGLIFYDAGIAWSQGQSVSLTRPGNYDPETQRYPVRSVGYGIRMNLFNFAVLRWDYAIPRDSFDRKGYWWFSIGPSF